MLPRRLYLKKVALLWLLHKAVQHWTATFGAGRRRWYKMSRSKVFQLSHPPIVSAVVITSAQVFAVCQLVLLFRKNPLWRVPLSSQWSIDYTKIDVSSTMISATTTMELPHLSDAPGAPRNNAVRFCFWPTISTLHNISNWDYLLWCQKYAKASVLPIGCIFQGADNKLYSVDGCIQTISLNTPGSSWNLAATQSINSYWCSPAKGISAS